MGLRVRIRKKDPSVPDSYVYDILKHALGITEEEAKKCKTKEDYLLFIVSDPTTINKLKELADKYSHLITMEYSQEIPKRPYTLAFVALKSNWRLAVVWPATFVILSILQIIPWFGNLFGIVLHIFVFSFLVMLSKILLETDLEECSVKETFSKIAIGDVKKFIAVGTGFLLADGVYSTIVFAPIFMVFIFIARTFLKALAQEELSSLEFLIGGLVISIGRVSITSLATFFLFPFFLYRVWFFYAFPLVLARVLRGGELTFGRGFMTFLSFITPSFIKESFSREYRRAGSIYLFIGAVVYVSVYSAFTVSHGLKYYFLIPISISRDPVGVITKYWFVFVISSVAYIILYWLYIYTAFVAAFYVKSKN